MGLPDDLILPCTQCMNSTFAFPPVGQPGLPSIIAATLASSMAGINFILDFIPPTPSSIASLAPPSIDLFIAPFLASASISSGYPPFSLGPLSLPAKPGPVTFDISGLMKLMYVLILLPFTIITNMVTKLLQLTIELPTIPGITAIFTALALDAGLSGPVVGQLGGCVATMIFNLFSALIPV